MQTIIHPNTYKYVHPVFSEIEQFFTYTSERKAEKTIVPKLWDNSFSMLYNFFTMFGKFDGDSKFTDKHYEPLELPEYDDNNVIVCFSAGKDSTALAQLYIEEGCNVFLYHVPKINPSQNREETEQAKAIAKYFNVPLYIEDLKISGRHGWIEHPMKNMIIASGALQYGIKNNITDRVAFGNYTTSSIEDDNFAFCSGDDIEMWIAYNMIIDRIIPDYMVEVRLKNIQHSMDIVCRNKELHDLTVGCLCRSSLRPTNKAWVEKTFGVKLPTHRCGQCGKCSQEYLWMVENGLQEHNKDYYAYCLNRLRIAINKEHEVKTTTIKDVCDIIGLTEESSYLLGALESKKL